MNLGKVLLRSVKQMKEAENCNHFFRSECEIAWGKFQRVLLSSVLWVIFSGKCNRGNMYVDREIRRSFSPAWLGGRETMGTQYNIRNSFSIFLISIQFLLLFNFSMSMWAHHCEGSFCHGFHLPSSRTVSCNAWKPWLKASNVCFYHVNWGLFHPSSSSSSWFSSHELPNNQSYLPINVVHGEDF